MPKADKILLAGLFEPKDLVSACWMTDLEDLWNKAHGKEPYHQIYLHVNTGAHHPLNPGLPPFKTRPD